MRDSRFRPRQLAPLHRGHLELDATVLHPSASLPSLKELRARPRETAVDGVAMSSKQVVGRALRERRELAREARRSPVRLRPLHRGLIPPPVAVSWHTASAPAFLTLDDADDDAAAPASDAAFGVAAAPDDAAASPPPPAAVGPMAEEAALAVLRQMELLKDLMEPLRDTLARELLRCGERRALGRYASVYRDGARGRAGFVVLRGKVEHLDSDGARCGEAGPSELVGEGAMVAAHVRRAGSARALEATELLVLTQPAVAALRGGEFVRRQLLRRHVAERLGATPFFRNLAWKVRWGVAALLEFVELRKGDRIFRKGDAGDALYVVVAGRVAISRRQQKALGAADGAGEGAIEILATVGAAAERPWFGELSLWLKEPRAADAAAAETPTTLLVLERSGFAGFLRLVPEFRDACRTAAESIKTINELSKRARLEARGRRKSDVQTAVERRWEAVVGKLLQRDAQERAAAGEGDGWGAEWEGARVKLRLLGDAEDGGGRTLSANLADYDAG